MTVYTHGHHESVLRSHRWRTLENSAAYLLPHLSPNFHVLDVGCGPGTITADLASRVTHVTAVEHTSAALDLARAEMAGRTNVSYVVTDAHALDLPDDSFDVVHAHQVLQHVGDPVQALREMRRVGKPGGLVAVRDSDYLGFTWFPERSAFDEWMRLYQEAALANGGDRRPDVACCRGHGPPGSLTSQRPRAPGASRTRRTVSTGAGCGLTASCSRLSRRNFWTPGWPLRLSCRRSRRHSVPGSATRTAGSASSTERSSPGHSVALFLRARHGTTIDRLREDGTSAAR